MHVKLVNRRVIYDIIGGVCRLFVPVVAAAVWRYK